MQGNKLIALLKSRKAWAAIVGLVVGMGLWAGSEAEQAEIAGALATVGSAIAYMIAVALEDGLSRR